MLCGRKAILPVLVLAAAAGVCAVEADDFRWTGTVAPGKTVEVKGINGGVQAQPSTSGRVEVVAHRSGRRSDPASVRIEVVEHPEGITICAVYPSGDGAANECKPGSGGRMRVRDNDVQVNFELKVPPGARFVARTVNGPIAAELPASEVEAHTVNGGVKLTGARVARAETVNGTVDVNVRELSQPMEIHTVNGAVEIALPPGARAEFDGRTVNGAISTDLPFTARGQMSKRHLSGTVGSPGGPKLEVKTVNGGIRLRTGS